MIPTIELNKLLSRYKISTAVAADVMRAQNYIPVTLPLISDRRIRGARKMVPSLSLALSLIRLRRNERIREVGGKLSAFSRLLARTAHSDEMHPRTRSSANDETWNDRLFVEDRELDISLYASISGDHPVDTRGVHN